MATVYALEYIGNTIWFRPSIRALLADYAYPIATIFWTGFSHIPNGPLQGTPLRKVPHTRAFYPTTDRDWVVDFWNLEVKWIFISLPIGILLTLLFYYDHVSLSPTPLRPQSPRILTNKTTERILPNSASKTIPSHQTRRLPLGLFSPRPHIITSRNPRSAPSQRSRSPSTSPHRRLHRIPRQARNRTHR